MDHREQEEKSAKSPMKNHPEDYKYTLKKESNKAAAKRSRLKKKSVENYNNEIRKNLKEINTKLMVENDLLRTEVRRLHLILDSHKSCPISTESFRDEMESSTIDFEIQFNGNRARPISILIDVQFDRDRARQRSFRWRSSLIEIEFLPD